MVVFTCGHCGESVQKPKVKKHYMTKCRNRNPNLSCMDCFKDFYGNAYEQHTKCITEEQRYSGKGFIAKEKKGEKKQNAWVEMLQSILDEQINAPRNVQNIIEAISKHNNTPRKKPKFVNFVKNVCGHKTNASDIDQAWDLIAVKLGALANSTSNNAQKQDIEIKGYGKTEENGANSEKENNHVENSNVKKQNSQDILNTADFKAKPVNGTEKPEKKKNKKKSAANGNIESSNFHCNQDVLENIEEEKADSDLKREDEVNKLTKKQLKKQKKQKKYEAELQSAATLPDAAEVEQLIKKEKKNKKALQLMFALTSDIDDSENLDAKEKKRKRQDTVDSNADANPETTENTVDEIKVSQKPLKDKKKKKLKLEAEESICLHDQNVALVEEETVKPSDFNWHQVIVAILRKKDNEVPFKRLQKKVLAEYSEITGYAVDDRIADKFIKKLKSAPNVRVDKNRVLLIQ